MTNKSICLLLHLACVFSLTFMLIEADRYCFKCQDNSNLASCNKVTKCGPHEECYIDKRLSDDGIVFFSQGCIDRQMCRLKRRNDVTACQQCCDTDFCNYKGCSDHGIEPVIYNDLCLDCGSSIFDSNSYCHTIAVCGTGYKCSVTSSTDFNGKTTYQFGCKADTDCADIHYPGNCNKCCTGPFCNYNCASAGGVLAPTIAALSVPKSTPIWSHITTQPWQLIPNRFRNATACFSCNGVSSTSDCSDFTHCGEHEQCYIETSITHEGKIIISGGCTSKAVCNPSSSQSDFNTRTCVQCCNTDFCNNNGCGQKIESTDRSHFCITCHEALRPEDCRKISRCDSDQLCFIRPGLDLNGAHTVSMGCARQSYCNSLQSHGKCSGCCVGAYCNTDCQTFNSQSFLHQGISSQNTPSTSYPSTTKYQHVTSFPHATTSEQKRVTCYSCDFTLNVSSCEDTAQCDVGEVCQLKELTGSNGMVAYRMRCMGEKICGKKDMHTRIGCCSTDNCNKNVQILI